MKKLIKWFLLVLVVAGLGMAGFKLFTKKEKVIEVEVAQIARGKITEVVTCKGKVTSSEVCEIRPAVEGVIDEVCVREGQEVEKGGLLCTIKNPDEQEVTGKWQSLQSCLIEIEQAKERLEEAKEKYKRTLESAELELAEAKENLVRYQMLYQELAVSKKEVEDAEKSLKKAELAYQEAEKSSIVREAEFSLKKQGFELERAKEAFSLLCKKLRPRDKIDLSQIYPSLKKAEITSPIAGISIKVNAKKGDMTKKDETDARFKIADLSTLFAELEVSEYEIGKVKLGQKVRLKTTDTKRVLMGHIAEISQETKKVRGDRGEESSSIIVRAKIDKGVGMRLGAGLEAEIEVSSTDNVLLAPIESILEAEGGKVVYVLKDKKAHLRQVKIGILGEKEAEVKRGLKEGEKVITVGALDVTEGARVKARNN